MLDQQWVDAIVQLVTAGGFGALVWYLICRHIPDIETRHRDERTEWRTFLESAMRETKESNEKVEMALLRVLEHVNQYDRKEHNDGTGR